MVKAPKNGKLRSVQHDDVIYTEINYICSLDICIKYLSRLNQVSPSLQWDPMRKGRGVSTFFIFCDATDHYTGKISLQHNTGGSSLWLGLILDHNYRRNNLYRWCIIMDYTLKSFPIKSLWGSTAGFNLERCIVSKNSLLCNCGPRLILVKG